ncbi:MAG: hypothetical protein AUG49_09865 [Catenulispora sp. 13_1_20CM_3_70_7]|nr:MAG: hypothetical protein AUG49_09865 [Catenulispora sp. 13_1_20CM_3_70_7]
MSRGVVVDVGGTSTRVAAHRDGRIAGDVVDFPTPSPHGTQRSVAECRDELFDTIARHAARLRGTGDEAGDGDGDEIGVSFGAVLSRSGIVRDASVLWSRPCQGFDVHAALRARFPATRISILNDVAAAAWHYRASGRFALVTVSTGVAFKVFDAALPADRRVLVDAEGLGGESGHAPVGPVPLGPVRALGQAAADGDPAALAELERLGLPWCACGAVADLCAYASGPGAVRLAAGLARREPDRYAASALAALAADPSRIETAALATAAAQGDAFTAQVLRESTAPLAARILQLCADLGLSRVLIVGGFAHGVGAPWLAALREGIRALAVDGGWFRDWTPRQLDELVSLPPDSGLASLAGMAAYLAERSRERDLGLVRLAVKPVGEPSLVLVSAPRPACGREQFLLRPRYAGICGTDLQILRGERGCEPGVPGHECVAEVVEVGDAVDGLAVGDTVTLNPNNPLDDEEKIGHNRDGVFGELLRFDRGMLRRGQVIRLSTPAEPRSVLLEPLAAVVRAQDLTGAAAPAKRVLVVGGGVTGLLHLMVAARRGATDVFLASRSADTRKRALALGLCRPERVLPLGSALAEAIRRQTDGDGVDTAIVAVGGGAGPAVLESVWPALAQGGAVHLFGGFPADAAIPVGGGAVSSALEIRAGARTVRTMTPAGRSAWITGSRGGLHDDFLTAHRYCHDSDGTPLAVEKLISHLIRLDELPAVAAELAGRGTVGGQPAARVVIDFDPARTATGAGR